jgi:opacity protein-like surface antigen
MRRGLTIISGGLLAILVSAGASFASEPPCPITQSSAPRLFLQTDNLKLTVSGSLAAYPENQQDYQLDTSLIGGATSSAAARTDYSSVELRAEEELAALRIRTDGAVTPYVGAGITTVPEAEETPGLSSFEAEREAERQAYLLGAGLACNLSHTARLNLGYRYAAGNLSELSGIKPTAAELENDDHHLSFGLKLDF